MIYLHTSNQSYFMLHSAPFVTNSLVVFRLTITASCPMNLQYFPMDRQLCHIEIESCKYSWYMPLSSPLPHTAITLTHVSVSICLSSSHSLCVNTAHRARVCVVLDTLLQIRNGDFCVNSNVTLNCIKPKIYSFNTFWNLMNLFVGYNFHRYSLTALKYLFKRKTEYTHKTKTMSDVTASWWGPLNIWVFWVGGRGRRTLLNTLLSYIYNENAFLIQWTRAH